MIATPEMIAAAWASWHSRHGGRIGPGPGFVEAIEAALAAAPTSDTIETLTRERDEARAESARYAELLDAAIEDYNKARGALKFYANRKNWGDGGFKECPDHDGMRSIELVMSSIDQDNGRMARAALKSEGGK